ncbi:Exocyst complex component SEC3A [Vitis vinifera]|uniref:Exocyst complex component SEC3A n=1 Tax=Vitis vinifera TaxID=29760 RepID=A0A438K1V2_VITVI|nr:Exocyst complex component SEC3A [Vitis vinifera]
MKSNGVSPLKIARVEEFLSRLQGKEVRRNNDNRLDWWDAKKGKFLVKSYYLFMGWEREIPFPSKAVWNPMVSLKTVNHILLPCAQARGSWGLVFLLFGVTWGMPWFVLQGLETATNCVDDMDEWLGIFNVKLRHMREDIESIETRNNKLEMQSVNNKALIEELEKLLERLRVPSEYAACLTGGPFDEARMLQNIEACEWLTGALRGLEVPNLDPAYANIRAVQGAFVEGRQILEAVLITNEAIDSILKNNENGFMCKLDIEKTYDNVDWSFLLTVMQKMGFGEKWIGWIKWCISTASFSVLINGTFKGFFQSSRGLRQGDPLSSYLFVIAMEVFSSFLKRAVDGVFQDQLTYLSWLLIWFEAVSGLRINLEKSELISVGRVENIDDLALDFGCRVGSLPSLIWASPWVLRLRQYECGMEWKSGFVKD